jgi:choline dehydrogenase
MAREHFDVIVVGAGSGGGVLAPRLTDDPSRRVLLLEAGPDFPDELDLQPGFYSGGHQFQHQYVGDHDWGYSSEVLPPENGSKPIRLPRGKMVGGSSMANAQMLVRGAPSDFDRWQAAGATGWSYDFMRKHYEAVEQEVRTKAYPRTSWQPLQLAFEEALLGLDYRQGQNFNDPDCWHGVVGATPINRINEVRQGTLVTYVRKARHRENLTIRPDTLVDKVIIEGGRAVAVRTIGPDGQAREVAADTIVLCGGAYGSPAILMRSGIGPAAHLGELGIPVVADLPVGERMLDHAVCYWMLENHALADMRGPSTALIARDRDNEWMSVVTTLDEGAGLCGLAFATTGDNVGGPFRLRSTDPTAAPVINHRYDVEPFRSAEEIVHQVLESEQFKGTKFLDAGRRLEDVVAERVGTCYHAAGTAPLGQVVDSDLRVNGIDGLMVADASVFPVQVSNNTNHTCYTIGEIAARKLGAAPRTY